MAVTLDTMTATLTVRQLIKLADEGNLRPQADGPYRGRVRILLNGHGTDALFGCIYVGHRTGRVLCAYLIHGNGGEEQRYDKVADIRRVLKSWAAIERTRGEWR